MGRWSERPAIRAGEIAPDAQLVPCAEALVSEPDEFIREHGSCTACADEAAIRWSACKRAEVLGADPFEEPKTRKKLQSLATILTASVDRLYDLQTLQLGTTEASMHWRIRDQPSVELLFEHLAGIAIRKEKAGKGSAARDEAEKIARDLIARVESPRPSDLESASRQWGGAEARKRWMKAAGAFRDDLGKARKAVARSEVSDLAIVKFIASIAPRYLDQED